MEEDNKDRFSDSQLPYLPWPPMQKEQLKQNGHVNGVMENGPMRQEESPFVDASETMQGSAPSVSEQLPQPGQDTQEYQRLSSPRLSSPGVSSSGVRPSRLSQMSPASAANAPGSQTNAKFAKVSARMVKARFVHT
eukprot:1150486-Pelagomonas_calceolata.AAC.2